MAFSPSLTNGDHKSYKEKTFAGVGNLIKLLPTGTVFVFTFLSPVLSNNGQCDSNPIYKYLTAALLAACGLSCFLSSFTDSYVDENGATRYGFATLKGFWPSPPPSIDASAYKIRVGDFVHAILTWVVFGVVALLDPHTVQCLYPSFESSQKVVLMTAPPVIGVISGAVFAIFPTTRHGIGYPQSSRSRSTSSKGTV